MDEAVDELGKLLAVNKLMVMGGAGISLAPPSSLPTWEGLLDAFVKECGSLADALLKEQHIPPRLRNTVDEFKPMVLDAAAYKGHPTRVASVLKDRLWNIEQLTGIKVHDELNEWFEDVFARATPNENHHLLVQTNFPCILTTNYDLLIENAAKHDGFTEFKGRSYNFTEAKHVAAAIFHQQPCIIHLHGKYTKTELNEIVFTAADYTRVKADPRFTMALQALFLGYSTLFVGYGGSDPHIENLLDEMAYFFKGGYGARAYVFLKEEEANRIVVEYRELLGMDVVVCKDYSETTTFLRRLKDAVPRGKAV
jgi:hypothetical protein